MNKLLNIWLKALLYIVINLFWFESTDDEVKIQVATCDHIQTTP